MNHLKRFLVGSFIHVLCAKRDYRWILLYSHKIMFCFAGVSAVQIKCSHTEMHAHILCRPACERQLTSCPVELSLATGSRRGFVTRLSQVRHNHTSMLMRRLCQLPWTTYARPSENTDLFLLRGLHRKLHRISSWFHHLRTHRQWGWAPYFFSMHTGLFVFLTLLFSRLSVLLFLTFVPICLSLHSGRKEGVVICTVLVFIPLSVLLFLLKLHRWGGVWSLCSCGVTAWKASSLTSLISTIFPSTYDLSVFWPLLPHTQILMLTELSPLIFFFFSLFA